MTKQTLSEQLASKFGREVETPKEGNPGWTLNGETQTPPEEQTIRKKLWDNGVVEVIIPRNAKVIKSDYLKKMYLQFSIKVRGGWINCYTHDKSPKKWVGKKIIARCEVWEKELKGGRKFLYIDFHPTNSSPTHKLAVISTAITPDDGQIAFPVQKPQQGAVVLTPIR